MSNIPVACKDVHGNLLTLVERGKLAKADQVLQSHFETELFAPLALQSISRAVQRTRAEMAEETETEKISQELAKEQHANGISQILTPSPSTHSSEETSPIPDAPEEEQQAPTTTQKKKKKKKSKKSAKAKEAAAAKAKADSQPSGDSNRPPVLCISRNKHWRYISSYHVR